MSDGPYYYPDYHPPILYTQSRVLEDQDEGSPMYSYSPATYPNPTIITTTSLVLSSQGITDLEPSPLSQPRSSPSDIAQTSTLEKPLSSAGHFLLRPCCYDDYDERSFSDSDDDTTYYGDDEYEPFIYDTDQLIKIELARGRMSPGFEEIFYGAAIGHLPLAADDTYAEEEPFTRVDYFIHEWEDEDLWASWKYLVSHRDVEIESERLENVSWRTWSKRKFSLRSISPESVDWPEDDSMWLYGPLKKHQPVRGPSDSKASLSPQAPVKNGTLNKIRKPILKKRTASETFLQDCVLSYEALRPAEATVAMDQSLQGKIGYPEDRNTGSMARPVCTSVPSSANSQLSQGKERRVHFNREVRQGIIIDEEGEDDYEILSMSTADNLPSDDDDLFVIELPQTALNLEDSSVRIATVRESRAVALLPPTSIKFDYDHEGHTARALLASLHYRNSTTMSTTLPINIPRYFRQRGDLSIGDDNLDPLNEGEGSDPRNWESALNISPFDDIGYDFEMQSDLNMTDLFESYTHNSAI